MAVLTGADTYFTSIETLTQTKWETYIDQAIDKINGYAHDTVLRNMTGVAGAKTLTVTSMAAGFIRSLTIAIYRGEYKFANASSKSFAAGGISKSDSTSTSGGAGGTSDVESLAAEAADALVDRDWSRAFI